MCLYVPSPTSGPPSRGWTWQGSFCVCPLTPIFDLFQGGSLESGGRGTAELAGPPRGLSGVVMICALTFSFPQSHQSVGWHGLYRHPCRGVAEPCPPCLPSTHILQDSTMAPLPTHVSFPTRAIGQSWPTIPSLKYSFMGTQFIYILSRAASVL